MRNDKEYQLCKAISTYLKLQYPHVLFHFDYAGLNLSIVQAARMKSIQGLIGYPDLFIAHPVGRWHGLFIEVKKDGHQIFTSKGVVKKDKHIQEQIDFSTKLYYRGYAAYFGYSFDSIKDIIDKYLNNNYPCDQELKNQ